ncbi:MAG TPA: TlpA disulfide reductase family protein [Bryobacteraceae bacterium]|nr:TlpA disulfide reductase family protein [Bryobacteraceae bacterium]
METKKAPPFTLNSIQGEPHSLSSILEQGPVLLAVFKISCPVCQLTMPFVEKMSSGSLPMVAISQDGPIATRRFLDTYKVTMTTLLDREEDGYPVSNALGITHVPSLFVVETDGTISKAFDGFNKAEMEAAGARAGIAPFGPGDDVPSWKAG